MLIAFANVSFNDLFAESLVGPVYRSSSRKRMFVRHFRASKIGQDFMLVHPLFRLTFIGTALSLLLVCGVPADETTGQSSRELLSRHGIQPTAAGTLAYLQRLKPDEGLQARVAILIKQLGSEVFVVRKRASSELTEIGEAAESQLEQAVQSNDLERSIRARQLLSTVRSLQNKDLNESLLTAALGLLKREKSTQTPTVILDIFPRLENRPLWYAASEALWANVQTANEHEIRGKLKATHLPTRVAAIVALELAAGEESVDDLQEFLSHENDAIRLAASRALMNRLPRDCLGTLVGLLAAEDVEIRLQASWLLRDLTGQKFGDDRGDDFQTIVNHWKQWADSNLDSAELQIPVGDQRLQLNRAVIIFREAFVQEVPSIRESYGRFRYASTIPANASVADGIFRLHGNHPEADQRLFIEAKNLTGGEIFPRRFLVKARLTGEAEGSGAYHVGVSVGRIKVLFHPDYSGGAFRVETADEHKYLVTNQSMGFTPTANVMHTMTLWVDRGVDGQVRIEATVTNGSNLDQSYVKRFVLSSDVVGPLNRIGLERSGRTGGDGLFDSVTIDLSGRR